MAHPSAGGGGVVVPSTVLACRVGGAHGDKSQPTTGPASRCAAPSPAPTQSRHGQVGGMCLPMVTWVLWSPTRMSSGTVGRKGRRSSRGGSEIWSGQSLRKRGSWDGWGRLSSPAGDPVCMGPWRLGCMQGTPGTGELWGGIATEMRWKNWVAGGCDGGPVCLEECFGG